MPRVVHFEIHAADPERAARFYRELFGWQITKWDGPMTYYLVSTGGEGEPGINGGLLARMGGEPSVGQPVNAYVCTVDVPDIGAYLGSAAKLGGSVAVPKNAIPGIGWLGYIKDTEGNIVGMMQNDPKAK